MPSTAKINRQVHYGGGLTNILCLNARTYTDLYLNYTKFGHNSVMSKEKALFLGLFVSFVELYNGISH